MRVIAGTARSLPLKTPEGMDTRPTTDRIKRNFLICCRLIFRTVCSWIFSAEAAASALKP